MFNVWVWNPLIAVMKVSSMFQPAKLSVHPHSSINELMFFFSISYHTCSGGFRSELCEGHSEAWIFSWTKYSFNIQLVCLHSKIHCCNLSNMLADFFEFASKITYNTVRKAAPDIPTSTVYYILKCSLVRDLVSCTCLRKLPAFCARSFANLFLTVLFFELMNGITLPLCPHLLVLF